MNALQEIVKKVASLPADTFATPSASEASPCSPWILNEINGSKNGVAVQQSHIPGSPDMHMKEEAVKCNGTQECNMPQEMNIKHTLDKESTNIQEEGTRRPQTLPMIRERQAQSPEENVTNSFSTPDSQNIRNSPFQARLLPNSPGVTSSPGRYVSANNNRVTPSSRRDFSPSSHGVNPSPGGSVSPGSLDVSTSPGRHVSPISPDVTPSPGKHVSPTSPDVTASSGRNFSPSSPDITPPSGRYLSPSSSELTPSPRQDDSSYSEVETNASDSVSVGSLSPERPLRQHCKFCHGQSPTRGHVSESSLSESISSSPSHPLSSSCAFCSEDVDSCGKAGSSAAMAEQNLQHGNMSLLETPAMKDGVCGRPPKDLSGMGLCSFDSNVLNGNEVQYPSRSVQQREASLSGYLPPPDQIINQAGAGGNALVGVEVQDSRSSATNNTTALSSSQWNSPREQSAFAQGSVSPLQQQTHVVHGSHVTKKENTELVPSAARLSPVTRHHQQVRPLQNEEDNSIAGPALPVPPPVVSVAPSPSNAIGPLMQKPLRSPPAPKPLLSPPAIGPGMQQPLLGNSPYWPGQHQHVPPLLSNLLASRFQQPGFPRQQFGNGPFVPPGVFNPAMFQGWDPNAFTQQQLLASRLPFGLPFQPVQNPVPRYRPPAGGRGVGAAGRGRSMAPRFHKLGIVNIKTCGDLEKMNTGRSSTLPPEQTWSVHSSTGIHKDTVGKNISTGSDTATSNASPSPVNLSPENTDVESRSREAARVKNTSVGSCAKSCMKPSWSASSASDLSPTNISDTMPDEPREETRCQSSLPGQGPGKYESVSEEHQLRTLSPTSSLPKQEGDWESPGTKKISPSKMSPSELLLKEQKSELKRIIQDNEMLRQSIDWRRSAGDTDNRGALKSQIHLKEVQLQKEKEIVLARKAEQELLYEREKLEAAFDQQLKKELETEQRIGETENKICLAKLENELLVLYQKLYGGN